LYIILFVLMVSPNILLSAKGNTLGRPITNFVLKTSGGNIKPDYGLYIVKYLKDIGVEVEIKVEENFVFEAQINYTHNYDLFIADSSVNSSNVDLFGFDSPVFDEIADPFGIHVTNWSFIEFSCFYPYEEDICSIPHMDYIDEIIVGILNSTNNLVKKELVFDLQELYMDRIIPFLPLFCINGSSTFTYLGFNSRRPLLGQENLFDFLSDPGKEHLTSAITLRKAICYAVDREEMNEKLHNNGYEIVQSIISPNYSEWYYNDVQKYHRNLELAKEWLGSGGYIIPEYEHENWFGLGFLMSILPYLIGVPVLLLITYGIVKIVQHIDKKAK